LDYRQIGFLRFNQKGRACRLQNENRAMPN
jgi:hypothetical protein